jgi:3-deoxy-D-manno-octulosonic-acid transferase
MKPDSFLSKFINNLYGGKIFFKKQAASRRKIAQLCQKIAQTIFLPRKLLIKIWKFEAKKSPKSRAFLGEFWAKFFIKK